MKKVLSSVMCLILILGMSFSVFATSGISAADAYRNLHTVIQSGKVPAMVADAANCQEIDYSANTYAISGGGYYTYFELVSVSSTTSGEFFVENKFSQLTSNAKQQFLKDMLDIAYGYAQATQYDTSGIGIGEGIDESTVNMFMTSLQNSAGMGSTVLSTVLKDYKPDFVSGNRLISPLTGLINTIVGVIALLVFMLLGAVMSLDIAYIMIPPLQLVFGDVKSGNGEQSGAVKFAAKFISMEAQKAVQDAQGGNGGEYKAPLGAYFGMRWKGLVVLAICLVLLINGLIYPFIGSFIDLFTGILGF